MENVEIVFIQIENGRQKRSSKSYTFSNSKEYKLKVGDIIKDVNYREEMIVVGFTGYTSENMKDLDLSFINGVKQENLPTWESIIKKIENVDIAPGSHSFIPHTNYKDLMNYSNLLILARYFNEAWKRSGEEICYSITKDDRIIKVYGSTTVGSVYFHSYKDAVKALKVYKKIRI